MASFVLTWRACITNKDANIDASEQFDQAVTLAPQNDMVLAWAGYFYMDTKDLSRARYLLQQAYASEPSE